MRSAEEIAAAALKFTLPADRRSFLDHSCAGDAGLRRRVDTLLTNQSETVVALDVTTDLGGSQPQSMPASGEERGSRIGPYRLVESIGAGGMGMVWAAEQEHPIRREVALKIIKPGMDSSEVIARFEAERQALAMMDHPNIAKVLDAGTTESGRPFFVMEFVRGVPITDYCDAELLGPRERLELLVPVCRAIQHAHQKGIIHRDIKPSNVLVSTYDGHPTPKVIDFGIAKATARSPLDSKVTQVGAIVGTLEYMSPEQAETGGADIDTRSDVYSLGVMMYELLTGRTPLAWVEAQKSSYVEILRRIREEEPPRPSTRLMQSTGTLGRVAQLRGIEPVKLPKLLRGELDWIVMKAIEKDRARRYETASSLARDIERYLNGEPVDASPPSATYRVRKFAGKHRLLLATVAAFVALLLAAVAVSTEEAIRAKRAEQAAMQERDRAMKAESAAMKERDRAMQAEAETSWERDHAMEEMRKADAEATALRKANQALRRELEKTR